MSDLKSYEKLKFEKLLGMDSGYVLDFSNSTFHDFILESTGIDIYNEKYNWSSGSKANRLRAFWQEESNNQVTKLNSDLLEHWKTLRLINKSEIGKREQQLYVYEECIQINERLRQESIENHIEVIKPYYDEKGFSLLAKSIRESIQKK
ncbi:MAG: hypothetical protein ACUBOA_01760 [Candidatus Loosdrechtia sp.]|uniref:hypothetical protein n=1 Tax=Candidatus Loosdrechtia sp. TaxID=3101272 RepID=UPI003A6A0AF2|nr:MAG: hypothetical protein QY305_06960 [Candidatus Jettenia sp. AMX2]